VLKRTIIVLLLAFGLSSCNDQVIIDVYEELPAEGWKYEDSVSFDFDIEDTTHYYQLFVNLQIHADYAWENFFTKITLIGPSGEQTTESVELTLAEKSGKWKGSGLGDIITYQEAIQKRQTFKQSGTYRVILEQNMRQEPWENLKSIGIRIEKQEEIF